jgi:phenylalanyl-tRNA synthetase alpha chain
LNLSVNSRCAGRTFLFGFFYQIRDNKFEENDLYDVIREIAGDLIENVECTDTFFNKKENKTSKCYRIHYRSLERTLKNEEVDELQFRIRDSLSSKLKLELR